MVIFFVVKFAEMCDGSWSNVASRTFLLHVMPSSAYRKWWFSRERWTCSLPVG